MRKFDFNIRIQHYGFLFLVINEFLLYILQRKNYFCLLLHAVTSYKYLNSKRKKIVLSHGAKFKKRLLDTYLFVYSEFLEILSSFPGCGAQFSLIWPLRGCVGKLILF